MRPCGRLVNAAAVSLSAVLALAGCTVAGSRKVEPGTADRAHRVPGFSPFTARQVDHREAMYPRLVRLRDGRIILSVATSTGDGITDMARFYESADGGRTFRTLSEIRDPAAAQGRGSCCGSLFELPWPHGDQPAGTLLWAGTAGMKNHAPGRRPELRVWRSGDGGRHWSYLSSCATGAEGTPWNRGLWEPELGIDRQGRLVCYYSDETRPGHDQVIAEASSTDGGATWSPARVVVTGGRRDRPGMPVVRRLPDGAYLMVYEVCGPSAGCEVRFRRSADGWTWGDPAWRGTAPRTDGGRSLYHAPTAAWVPGGGANGTVLLVGGLVRDSGGGLVQEASGATILTSARNGDGAWQEASAPVRVPFPADPEHPDIVCSNYSSTLLPTSDGKGLLEVATQRDKDGTCRAYAAAVPLPLTATGPQTRS
ncbi:sialidase family protein [Spirillospora sp. NPDC049024]